MREFDKVFQAGNYTVSIDTPGLYGCFEHDILGDNSGGGLWFERGKAGQLELTDYDGVFALPKQVASGLREHGYVVSSEFD